MELPRNLMLEVWENLRSLPTLAIRPIKMFYLKSDRGLIIIYRGYSYTSGTPKEINDSEFVTGADFEELVEKIPELRSRIVLENISENSRDTQEIFKEILSWEWAPVIKVKRTSDSE